MKKAILGIVSMLLLVGVVDKSMVVTDESGNGAYAIPYVVEGYGIIYNDEIMQRYFSLGSKSTSYNSMTEINNFD